MDRRAEVATCKLQLAIMNHRLILLDYEGQMVAGPKGSGSVHGYPQTDGYTLGTMVI